jgi:hypothetical protein
MMYLKKQK